MTMPPFAAPSPTPASPRRAWAGPWLMGVAAVHTAFAAVVFAQPLQTLFERGVWNSVGQDPMLGAVVWFVLFGLVLALLGGAVSALERAGAQGLAPLRRLGAGLLAMVLLGIVLMPASGFWLALVPALWLCARPRPHAAAVSSPSSSLH